MANIMYYLSMSMIVLAPITGIVLLIDKYFFAKKRDKEAKLPILVDWSLFLFPVLAFVSVMRCFIAEPFVIPSGSMQPTLYAGDMIIADKWSFGLRYPIVNTRIFSKVGDGVERGDIAVFRYPEDTRQNYIKRIIGLPGDIINYQNKRFTINGKVADISLIGNARPPETSENLANEVIQRNNSYELIHKIQYANQFTQGDGIGGYMKLRFPLTVPAGHYLAIGDNRDHSQDSRFWGFVPDENLVGKAQFIWMNYNCIFRATDCAHIGTKLK